MCLMTINMTHGAIVIMVEIGAIMSISLLQIIVLGDGELHIIVHGVTLTLIVLGTLGAIHGMMDGIRHGGITLAIMAMDHITEAGALAHLGADFTPILIRDGHTMMVIMEAIGMVTMMGDTMEDTTDIIANETTIVMEGVVGDTMTAQWQIVSMAEL